jgi:hypothetical protein
MLSGLPAKADSNLGVNGHTPQFHQRAIEQVTIGASPCEATAAFHREE